jgi:hypothetical protein
MVDIWDDLYRQHGKGQTQQPSGGGDVWDNLYQQHGVKPGPRIIPVDDKPSTPGERKFAQELQDKADRMLVGDAGPLTAAAVSAANTFGLNLPRRAASYVQSFKTGNAPDQEYQRLKSEDEALARLYPKSNFGGMALGAIGQAAVMPGAPAATMAGRAAQSATLGGLLSGSAEFVDTGNADAANRAALGGFAVGALGSPVVDVAGKAIGAVARPAINTVRGMINPEAEAGRRVASALATDKAIGQNRMDATSWQKALNDGQPVVVADVGGETTKALARSAANTSPEARAALTQATSDRFGNQNERIGDFIQGFGSGKSAVAISDTLDVAARRANRPAYDAAYKSPNAGAVWNEDLAQLMQAPAVQQAIAQASRSGANKAAAQGFKPPSNPFVRDPQGNFTLRTNEDGSVAIPSLQFWDYVQRNLNDQIGTLTRKGAKSAASDAIALRNQLNDILDNTVPEFKAARAGAAQFFGAQDALEAGRNFVTSKMNNAEAAKAMAKMTQPEKALFAEGFISDMVDKVRNVADRQNVLGKIFNSQAARQRVEMAIGPKRAKELEAFLHTERIMDELRTAVSGNSTTARQLAEAGLAGGAAGGFLGGGDPTDVSFGAALSAASRRLQLGVDARVAKRVGEMLASQDPQIVQKAVAMVTKNKSLMDMLRKAQVSLTGASAGAYGANQ